MSVTLKAYYDGSGSSRDPNSPILTLAGHIGKPDAWAAFDEGWRSVLSRWGVSYLHTKALKARQQGSEFEAWTDEQERAFLKDLFTSCFGQIQWGADDFIGVTCSVRIEDYQRAQSNCPRLKTKAIEAFCVDCAVDPALRMLPEDTASPFGRSGRIELVFDQGEPFLKHVNAAWERRRRNKRDYMSVISRISKAHSRTLPGLQAADYAAWLANKDVRDGCSASNILRHFLSPGYRYYFDYEKLLARYGG